MATVVSVFNNKGGVGKSTICWNVGDSLARLGKRVLLVDFDPQCNLSIAMLGETALVEKLPTQNVPYGTTVRAFLQRFLQNTGGEEIFLHKEPHTSQNVDLAGDFWLNVYADTLNVGSDLLAGTGLSRYVSIGRIVKKAEESSKRLLTLCWFTFHHLSDLPSEQHFIRLIFMSSRVHRTILAFTVLD